MRRVIPWLYVVFGAQVFLLCHMGSMEAFLVERMSLSLGRGPWVLSNRAQVLLKAVGVMGLRWIRVWKKDGILWLCTTSIL